MARADQRVHSLPAVDERLVAPESGAEILDGRLVMSPPGADPPHAMRHLTLAYLLGAHVAPGHVAAVDMLTRTDRTSDFAPDVSVFPAGIDQATGGRRLEVLAFEIVSKQRLSAARRKAKKLVARGVERVFALVLRRERALEWDRGTGDWRPLHLDEQIVHRSLAAPLPVRALLDTARADEAVLAALGARRPDLIARIEARARALGRREGVADGAREAERGAVRQTVEALCRVLAIRVSPTRAAWLASASLQELRAVAQAIETDRRWPRTKRAAGPHARRRRSIPKPKAR
ncbi:MAG: Uma2 family endonuclease [Sandaracinus sp.]